MAAPDKPRHSSGYSREETREVESTLLTVAVTLGAYFDRLCIVGGLVPSLLLDGGLADEDDDRHVGSGDVDVALHIGLLNDGDYAEVSDRLRREGFEPDVNEEGNKTLQRWRLGKASVTIDFLIPLVPDSGEGRRLHKLEPDFGAIMTKGLELAFEEIREIQLAGHTRKGEAAERTIPVCGPAAFVILKSFAFQDRGEPKDAYDLVYVIRRAPGGAASIAETLEGHAVNHAEIVREALERLASNFETVEHTGPVRAADFISDADVDRDADRADAQGAAADLVSECRRRGLITSG
ncbi:MAG TPA: nucleotidyl transferase AbiEii/AbiGii toxin family protein [Solirubrobacterales bacterium]